MRDWSRFDAFVNRLAWDVYPEPAVEPHIQITRNAIVALHKEGHLVPGMRVLDVGCGSGLALRWFAELALRPTGITLGSECDGTDFDVHQMDQNFMTFEDETFDFLWSRHCLEHSFSPFFTLQEYHRVTKPGGRLYVEVPSPDTSPHHEYNPNHYCVMGLDMWGSLMHRARLSVERCDTLAFEAECGPDTYWAFHLKRI